MLTAIDRAVCRIDEVLLALKIPKIAAAASSFCSTFILQTTTTTVLTTAVSVEGALTTLPTVTETAFFTT